MPEKRWTVNERNVGMGPQAYERLQVSYDEYIRTLSKSLEESNERFGCAPVKDAYFKPYNGLDINNMNGLSYLNLNGEDMQDLSQELEDLLKIYTKEEEELEIKEKTARDNSDHFMRIYLKIKEERELVTLKKNQLLAKLSLQDKCLCGCEDEEEDDE